MGNTQKVTLLLCTTIGALWVLIASGAPRWAFRMLPDPVQRFVGKRHEPAGGGVLYRRWPDPPVAHWPSTDVILCMDLHHPPQDPDDHFDLAVVYALTNVNVLGIVLDDGARQQKAPGHIPVAQMNYLTGSSLATYPGLAAPLSGSYDDGAKQAAAYQAGVQFILNTLQAASNQVTVITTGSLRDIAAAYNRDPSLLKEKIDRLYAFIGSGTLVDCEEYNVQLDPYARDIVFASDLPVYWIPCFHAGRWTIGPHGSWWQSTQSRLWNRAPDAVVQYFLYALEGEQSNPISFLHAPVDAGVLSRHAGVLRNLWCAGLICTFFAPSWRLDKHGLTYYHEDKALYSFIPMASRSANDEIPDGPSFSNPNLRLFRIHDTGDYQEILTRKTAKHLGRLRVNMTVDP